MPVVRRRRWPERQIRSPKSETKHQKPSIRREGSVLRGSCFEFPSPKGGLACRGDAHAPTARSNTCHTPLIEARTSPLAVSRGGPDFRVGRSAFGVRSSTPGSPSFAAEAPKDKYVAQGSEATAEALLRTGGECLRAVRCVPTGVASYNDRSEQYGLPRRSLEHMKGVCARLRLPRPRSVGSAAAVFACRIAPSEDWWSRAGSNRRPHPCEGCALPAELLPHLRPENRTRPSVQQP